MPIVADRIVCLHAAGSLRAALTDIAEAFRVKTGVEVTSRFGPSGLLKDAILQGEPAEVFASANLEHPQALVAAGRTDAVSLFARNRLCALASATLAVDPDTILDVMLDPAVKLGTSTPRADPSGDYAFAVFARAEALRPGAQAALERKALQLTGGPTSPPPPADGISLYGKLVSEGAADLFLTYRTGAATACRDFPDLKIIDLPPTLAVGADYGLTVLREASAPAFRFALFVLSREGQHTLAAHGFDAPGL